MKEFRHTPVMLKEVMEYLDPKLGEYFIDCTLGGAGYTMAIAEKVGEEGKVLAIDLDPLAIENAKNKIKNKGAENIILANDNFKNLSKIIKENFKSEQLPEFSGIVLDLGLSGAQLEDRDRGFSFKSDNPLNMAFGPKASGQATIDIVNNSGEKELERIIREYGEERFSKRIAREILNYRKIQPIKTTGQLVEIVKIAIPRKFQYGLIHPATKTFQALRIATNKEMENLEEVLPQAVNLLKKGGRLAIISFHSLEDKIVKRFFKEESRGCICPPQFPICRCEHKAKLKIITAKVLKPTEEEIEKNSRSRSSKMRVAEKL